MLILTYLSLKIQLSGINVNICFTTFLAKIMPFIKLKIDNLSKIC